MRAFYFGLSRQPNDFPQQKKGAQPNSLDTKTTGQTPANPIDIIPILE